MGELVGSLQSHRNDDAAAASAKEYVVPATTGFYVRFQGTFAAAAKLSLVYTVFGYGMGTVRSLVMGPEHVFTRQQIQRRQRCSSTVETIV